MKTASHGGPIVALSLSAPVHSGAKEFVCGTKFQICFAGCCYI